jgi:hypothetical protein
MDFTLVTYNKLLTVIKNRNISTMRFTDYLSYPGRTGIILRHDVDKRPENSLRFAEIQFDSGIQGTYYFRTVPESFNDSIISKIASMGHEIGYHYEDLSLAAKKFKGVNDERMLVGIAIDSFRENLKMIRNIAPVTTACMHGSPLSKWDSRLIWKYAKYSDFGLVGEPYLSVNFKNVMYLTDTGRRWDGDTFNVRDRQPVGDLLQRYSSGGMANHQEYYRKRADCLTYRSTYQIIQAIDAGYFPPIVMMTFHPQRWTDDSSDWLKEIIFQNLKNTIKYFLRVLR